jgi:hypothetical protein
VRRHSRTIAPLLYIKTRHQCCSQSSPGIELVDGNPPALCNVKLHDVVAESHQTLLPRQKRDECYRTDVS